MRCSTLVNRARSEGTACKGIVPTVDSPDYRPGSGSRLEELDRPARRSDDEAAPS